MFHVSKLPTKVSFLLGLVGVITAGGYVFVNSLNSSVIAQSSGLSPANPADLTPLPEWFKAGSYPQDFAMGADHHITHSGSASWTVQARNRETEGFGTLMQVFDASAAYRGQRLRLSGYLKTEAVETWTGLWMRVDGANNEMLSFDNMQNCSITGTTK